MSLDPPDEDTPASFYLPAGPGRYLPTDATTSPWDPSSQHGGPPTALLATCIDEVAGDEQTRLARLSIDFLGPIPRREFAIEAAVTRPGRRIRQAEATISVDGRVAVRASAWYIKVDSSTAEATPPPRPRTVADRPLPQPQRFFPGMDRWGHGESVEWRFAEGSWAEHGPAKVWTRVRVPVLPDQPLTGLQHAVMVADSTNGLSNELHLGDWFFIPPSLTVTLLRHPVGEWVYVDAHTTFSGDGVGIAYSDLADEKGFIGSAIQPLLISPR